MSFARRLSVAVVALVGMASYAHAQQSTKGIEIGMDAALSHAWASNEGNSVTTFEVPTQAIRLGIGLSSNVSLEPEVGFRSESGSGSFKELAFDLGLPVDIAHLASGSQLFVRPLAGVAYTSEDGGSSHQNSFGAGFGMRVPLITHVMTRFEARYRRWLKSDESAAYNQVDLLAGFSIVTR